MTVSGIVTDPSSATIPGAHIVLRCGDWKQETTSDATGAYTLRVPTGVFGAEVSHAGFETLTRDLTVAGSATEQENFTLAITHAMATVSVSASEGYVADSSSAATKTDAPLLDTPQSVSVITNEQLEQRDVQTLNEALRYTPGVTVEAYGVDPRYDSFLIRGFRDDTNGVFIDGQRFPGYLGQTDPYLAADVTVLKGPSSVLYGQSAPGGLVNITTKRPPVSDSREVQVDFGSYDRKQV